jgi:bacterioferritin-associated ferredoxin
MRIIRITLQPIMIVCICHRVSERAIERAASEGCTSFEALQEELCVGRACGACETCARDTLAACLRTSWPSHAGRTLAEVSPC